MTSLHIKPSDERLQVPFCLLNSSIPQVPSDSVVILAKTESTPDAARLLELLQEAVKKRLVCLRTLMGRAMGQEVSVVRGSRIAVLFSGGLDSAVLAALTDRYHNKPLIIIKIINPVGVLIQRRALTSLMLHSIKAKIQTVQSMLL